MRLALFALFFSLVAHAEMGTIHLQYGLGAENSFIPNGGQKMINLGWNGPIISQLYYRVNGGVYWAGPLTGQGFAQLGFKIEPLPWLVASHFVGPGFITRTDRLLGSHFQFNIVLGLAWKTPFLSGAILGALFSHISDAGSSGKANLGRNAWLFSGGWEF